MVTTMKEELALLDYPPMGLNESTPVKHALNGRIIKQRRVQPFNEASQKEEDNPEFWNPYKEHENHYVLFGQIPNEGAKKIHIRIAMGWLHLRFETLMEQVFSIPSDVMTDSIHAQKIGNLLQIILPRMKEVPTLNLTVE